MSAAESVSVAATASELASAFSSGFPSGPPSASPADGNARACAASSAPSALCPLSHQYHPAAATSRTAARASPAPIAPRSAEARLSCSTVSRASHSSCSARRRYGSAVSASPVKYAACARRTSSRSPASASFSRPYARIVSSIRYRPSPAVTSRDLSASDVIRSSTSSTSTGPPAQTPSAASTVAPPAKTARRRSSARSASVSSSQLQSTTARSVWCWRGAVRAPPVSSRNRSSSRAASCSALIVRSRAAASSMASGIPSSARQIRVTAGTVSSVTVKPERAAAARSFSSRTAAYAMACSASASRGGRASGRTGHRASPVRPSGSRLVARMRSPGHSPSSRSASAAAAPIRCSQLSSTRSAVRVRSAAASRSRGSPVADA